MATTQAVPLESLISRRAKDLPGLRVGDPRKSAEIISFYAGFPDRDSLPKTSVIEATKTALEAEGEWALQYGHGLGNRNLAQILLDKLRRDFGIEAEQDQILITAGASQAIGLAIEALVDWGDTIITEAPTWMGAVRMFRNAGAQPVNAPVDAAGTNVEALEKTLADLKANGITAKFIYTIPNFQNPTGVSTSPERRERIVELAHEYGTFILEDDAYADLRYSGEQIPPIFSLDNRGTTLYFGTLSKTLGAGMRLGWVVAHPALVSKMGVLKVDGSTNVFGSYVAAEWIPDHLDKHIEELKAIYQHRRDLMLAELQKHFPEGCSWTEPEGGFFIWVTLPKGVDTTRMAAQARERGVEYLPGRSCFTDGSGQNMLRLSYSFARDEEIGEGIRILGEIIDGEMAETGQRQASQ
ncbi:MAG TPA: PLP-dependent aminotransferase family protein [Thermomicrobiales bacterium]|nr:PLP-dependent aminotransferase family protein [Thermomicrobiales bacterium]